MQINSDCQNRAASLCGFGSRLFATLENKMNRILLYDSKDAAYEATEQMYDERCLKKNCPTPNPDKPEP